MNKEEKADSGLTRIIFSWPGLMVALSVLGMIVGQRDFELSRPAASAEARREQGNFQVESRSWQDPFQGIRANKLPRKLEDGSAHGLGIGLAPLSSEILKFPDTNRLAIVAITVNGNPYPHHVEMRLRNRMALQSAMRAEGFVRSDSSHIRFMGFPTVTVSSNWLMLASGNNWQPSEENTVLIAYEWFRKDRSLPEAVGKYDRALVLWLKEEDFASGLLTRLGQLIDCIVGTNSLAAGFETNTTLTLLGPGSSGGLEQLMRSPIHLPNTNSFGTRMVQSVRIVSTSATAPDAFLCETNLPDNFEPFEARKSVENTITNRLAGGSFVQVGKTDEELCFLLLGELYLRNINPLADRIVLLSEYDTFYGRQFPLTFKAAAVAVRETFPRLTNSTKEVASFQNLFGPHATNAPERLQRADLLRSFVTSLALVRASSNQPVTNIQHYTFLAGMDGSKTLLDNPKEQEADAERILRRRKADSLDRPEGDQQLDYMRRLAEDLEASSVGFAGGRGGLQDVKAVGLLGNDFYDKLIILQALRPKLPGCVFFTTDLDARMNHVSKYHWTRNLLVASSFDLKPPVNSTNSTPLRTPPFRDSYQTALFVGCRAALTDSARNQTGMQHDAGLYEIGRNRHHRLSPVSPTKSNSSLLVIERLRDVPWKQTPEALKRAPELLARAPSLVVGLAAFGLVLGAVFLPVRRSLGFSYWVFLGGGAAWMVTSIVVVTILFGDGLEPMEIGDGVSALTSAILFALAVGLGVFCIFLAHRVEGTLRTDFTHWSMALCVFAIIVATIFLLWDVAIPVRGSQQNFKFVFLGAWCVSSIATVYVASFWVMFYRRLGAFLMEVRHAGTHPLTIRNTNIESELQDAIAAVERSASSKEMRTAIRDQGQKLVRLANECPDPIRLIKQIKRVEKGMWQELEQNKGSSHLADVRAFWRRSMESLKERLAPRTLHDLICEAHEFSSETDRCDKLLVYPMVMILLLILACSPWSDSWSWTIWMWLLVVLKLVLLVLFPILLNRTAGKLRETLNQLLVNERVKLDPGSPASFLDLQQDLVDRLNQGCFSALHRHPVFAALAGLLGGSGFVNFLQPLLSAHW